MIEQIHVRAAVMEHQFGRPARIGGLGLAFKPNLDGLRKTPALQIITELLALGLDLLAYEPNTSNHPAIKLHSLAHLIAEADLLVFLVASPLQMP